MIFFDNFPFSKGVWLCRFSCLGVSISAQKKLVHDRQLARALSFALAIALTSLELPVRSKICLSTMQSFLLPKHTLGLIQGKTG